ncbi:TPT-domain-containing protein [Sodiomyces alkalinus F11]|uniref:TPT-domain-containing protein n=1 Tax=Sodiomyces alkalinus (strain CBS 110278 / VKM F-3762 / F11) TaxID=1314773 RepID=A0A3N2PJ65_SODAK|nr:TPT-domain-containing protein [Sodiomyces alkalinus F11]ROT34565.1 TPT-domain-containing protein [Sodiomyces alkalinus F11]
MSIANHLRNWIFFSNLTIIFNKWLLDTAGFKYRASAALTPCDAMNAFLVIPIPSGLGSLHLISFLQSGLWTDRMLSLAVILTCWHLIFATIATQLLARTTSLLDNRHHVKMTGRLYLRAIVPIGLLYSGSLVCSNLVYVYLSVPFIQMLKSASPVAVLFVSWLWGVADPNARTILNILVIVFGVALASVGEIEFSWLGFLFQVGGTCFEAVRLVMIQVLLKGDDSNGSAQQMDPLVSLYYYAPICAFTNFLVAIPVEALTFNPHHLYDTGFLILLLNAAVAFILNIASVSLIGRTSGLVMTLTGILKNILLIATSILIWRTNISLLQGIGYSIAIFGLVLYSTSWDQLKTAAANSFVWFSKAVKNPEDGRLSPLVRRGLIAAVLLFFLALLVTGYLYSSAGVNPFSAIKSGEWSEALFEGQ